MARSKRWFVMVQATPEEKEEYKKVSMSEGELTVSGWFRRMAKAAVKKWKKSAGIGLILILTGIPGVFAETINPEKLCQAIYHAEGGAKTKHPYGIMQKYKTTTPKQACLNTVNNNYKRWKSAGNPKPYLEFLRDRYAPLEAHPLNANWLSNVSKIYESLNA